MLYSQCWRPQQQVDATQKGGNFLQIPFLFRLQHFTTISDKVWRFPSHVGFISSFPFGGSSRFNNFRFDTEWVVTVFAVALICATIRASTTRTFFPSYASFVIISGSSALSTTTRQGCEINIRFPVATRLTIASQRAWSSNFFAGTSCGICWMWKTRCYDLSSSLVASTSTAEF